MNEIWADIPQYEGMYQASNMGRIRSIDRMVTSKRFSRFLRGKILNPATQRNGYEYVSLCREGRPRTHRVHRLVALTFIPRPDNDTEVDHVDFNKKNNVVSNLRWVCHLENSRRSNKGKHKDNNMGNNPRTKRVEGVDLDGYVIEEYPCAKYLTVKYGINYSTLRYHLQRGGVYINKLQFKYAS